MRMRQESKPDVIQDLEREIIQLRVEQEALKRDSGLGLGASMVRLRGTEITPSFYLERVLWYSSSTLQFFQ